MRRLLSVAMLALGLSVGCGGAPPNHAASAPEVRKSADGSRDIEKLGRWLLAEMLSPEGSADEAKRAHEQLVARRGEREKEHTPSLFSSLAVGLYDEAHGTPGRAAPAFAEAVDAARLASAEDGALYGWFAANHLVGLRGSVRNLYQQHQPVLERAAFTPRSLGWRGASVLLEWVMSERAREQKVQSQAFEHKMTQNLGCATSVALAGPFGSGVTRDLRQRWPAEDPGSWPVVFEKDPIRGVVPKRLKTERARCAVTAAEETIDGVYYAQTFFETKEERSVLVSVQGARDIWIDDTHVLERDLRDFGSWQRFGATAVVGPGRHRILARLGAPQATVRILNPDGTPLGVEADSDDRKPYGLVPPRRAPSPNPLERAVQDGPSDSPFVDLVRAHLLHADGLDDVASWLLEPHIKVGSAGPVLLEFAALYARGDAAFGEQERHNNEKALHQRAVRRDPDLWYSQAWLALDEGARQQPLSALQPLKRLAERYPGQPELSEQLVRLYARLGYDAERVQLARALGAKFPDDLSTQRLLYETVVALGSAEEADQARERIKQLDPDAEIDLELALARLDFKAALAELERLQQRKPQRRDIAAQIAKVLLASGDPRAAMDELAKAVQKNPDDPELRLKLADRAFASGDAEALRRELAEAIARGSKTEPLRDAVDLLEGRTALEAYRRDGAQVIRDFAAWEKAGNKMDGSAARVLDYSALWVHPDGSSEMLEHEILKMQTQDAISREAEQSPPRGLVLKLRVIKPDGRTFEPQPVPGKPTLTMPHLEVGDYLEIEHITRTHSEARGLRYHGPTWFFREADKGYWHSEFLTFAPKNKNLMVETRGVVPEPEVRELGSVIARRWLVKESPPAPEEPNAPPPQEFLPSVRIGWGISLAETVAGFVGAASDESARDPRLLRRAQEITRGVDPKHIDELARRLYREVADTIQDGQETDGRRVLSSKSGSRQAAFTYLLRQMDIRYDYALVQNKLAPPAESPLSEVDAWSSLVLRVHTEKGPRWLTVRDKFAPYGYLPAELRGQPAIVLTDGTPRTTTSKEGSLDTLVVEGRAELDREGSAKVELVEHFHGKLAISMRSVLERVPEAQLADFVETRLVGNNIPGFRVQSVKVEKKDNLDGPVALRVVGQVPALAKRQGQQLVLQPVFPLRLSDFAELAERQTTLVLSSSSRLEIDFQVVVPEGVRLPSSIPAAKQSFGDASVDVQDSVQGRSLRLRRTANVPAIRVPVGDYPRFVDFARGGDAIFEREIVLGL